MNEELQCFLDKTISDFDKNIHYKDDLKYIKVKFIQIVREYNKYINKLNNQIIKLKKEINEEQIKIKCPYCSNIIGICFYKDKNEYVCPKCFELIEIDWE